MNGKNSRKTSLSNRFENIRFLYALDCALAFLFLIVEVIRAMNKYGSSGYNGLVSLIVFSLVPLLAFIYICFAQISNIKMANISKANRRQNIIILLSLPIIFINYYLGSFNLCISTCSDIKADTVSMFVGLLTFIMVPIIIKIIIRQNRK